MTKINNPDDKVRVVTLLTRAEWQKLQKIAWKSGRSMSGFIRNLIIEELDANRD